MSPGTEIRRFTVEEEFEKNPELNKEDLDDLREWVVSQKHLPEIKDEMLVLFHHSCYFNLARTKDCVDAYYTLRTMAPDMFKNRDLSNTYLKRSIDVLNIAMLPVRDPNGYQIFYHGLRDYDPAKFFHADDNKIIYMTVDAWLLQHGTAPGLVLLMDMKGAKLGHLTRVSFTTLRLGSRYVQEGSPLRLKAIHVINTLSWVDKVMAIVKPFTSKEIFDLMHFHKGDMETLYEHIPRECLPCDFGGTLPPVETFNEENLRTIQSLRDYFKEEEKYRVDESKRDKKKKKNKKFEEIPETHFSKLEID